LGTSLHTGKFSAGESSAKEGLEDVTAEGSSPVGLVEATPTRVTMPLLLEKLLASPLASAAATAAFCSSFLPTMLAEKQIKWLPLYKEK